MNIGDVLFILIAGICIGVLLDKHFADRHVKWMRRHFEYQIHTLTAELDETLDAMNILTDILDDDSTTYVYRIDTITTPDGDGFVLQAGNPLYITSNIPDQWKANTTLLITQLSDEDAALYMRGLL